MCNEVIHYPNETIKYGLVEAVVDALEKISGIGITLFRDEFLGETVPIFIVS